MSEHAPPLYEMNGSEAPTTSESTIAVAPPSTNLLPPRSARATSARATSARERATTLGGLLARRGASNVTDLSKEELFRVLDSDGSGSIDVQQFDRLYEAVRTQTRREMEEAAQAKQYGAASPIRTGVLRRHLRRCEVPPPLSLLPPPHRLPPTASPPPPAPHLVPAPLAFVSTSTSHPSAQAVGSASLPPCLWCLSP